MLLPSDHQYKAEELLSLFLRRQKRIKRFTSTARPASEGGEGEQAYNYSNSADNSYVAPQELDFDDHDQGFDDDYDGGGEEAQAGGFEFVAEPTKVPLRPPPSLDCHRTAPPGLLPRRVGTPLPLGTYPPTPPSFHRYLGRWQRLRCTMSAPPRSWMSRSSRRACGAGFRPTPPPLPFPSARA